MLLLLHLYTDLLMVAMFCATGVPNPLGSTHSTVLGPAAQAQTQL
jgi:hypothetical protein